MANNELYELIDNYFNVFTDMTNDTKIETFKLGMIKVYKKLVEMAETESEAAQFFMNVMAIICSIDAKGFSKEIYNYVICSLSGDILGFKQFSKIVEVFSEDKKSTAEHVKVLTSFDDATKDELMKAKPCCPPCSEESKNYIYRLTIDSSKNYPRG